MHVPQKYPYYVVLERLMRKMLELKLSLALTAISVSSQTENSHTRQVQGARSRVMIFKRVEARSL